MRVIIKPMGLFFIGLCLLGLLGTVMILMRRPPVAVSSSSSKAPQETHLVDEWSLRDSGKTIYQGRLGDAYQEFVLEGDRAPKITPESGKFSVTVKADSLGTNQYSKYGVRIYTTGPIEMVEAWIDPKFKVLATCGRGLAWKNSPLPAGFNMKEKHVVTMEWSDKGSTWTVTLDNDPTVRQVRTLGRPNPAERVSLVTQDAKVSYSL